MEIKLTLENCILPLSLFSNSPSVKDGMDNDLEADLRITGCEYIQAAGLLLKLPQVSMATAQILFQRFFYSKSFVKFNCYYAMMSCLFLAAKIEESSRRLRDVINVFHFLRQKRCGSTTFTTMDYVGEEYFRMRNCVNKYERYILKELGFCVHVEHPHKLIVVCLQILEHDKNKALAQKSWNYMNDSLRSNVFVRFSVQSIACSCIFLAARQMKIPLPHNPPWWQLLNVQYNDIKTVSLEILALYQRTKKSLTTLEKKVEVVRQVLITKSVPSNTESISSQNNNTLLEHLSTVDPDGTKNNHVQSMLDVHEVQVDNVPTNEPLSNSCHNVDDVICIKPLKPIISPIRISSGPDDEKLTDDNLSLKRNDRSPDRRKKVNKKHRASEKHRHHHSFDQSRERSRSPRRDQKFQQHHRHRYKIKTEPSHPSLNDHDKDYRHHHPR